jgi:hypothetical protein
MCVRLRRCEGHRAPLDVVPTVHRAGPYRFFFYSTDRHEPPHIQVERDSNRAKSFGSTPFDWPIAVGFLRQLRHMERLVTELSEQRLRAWHEHFTD